MPSYVGRVVASPSKGAPSGAGGPLFVTVPNPDQAGAFITGNLKIGSKPRQGITGFSGSYEGGSTFVASGENTRGQGVDQVHIAVIVSGVRSADLETVSGTVKAVINGVEQPDWTFAAALEGADLPDMAEAASLDPTGAVGVFSPEAGLAETEDLGFLERTWDAIPDPLKVAGGLAVAVGTGIFLWRRRK